FCLSHNHPLAIHLYPLSLHDALPICLYFIARSFCSEPQSSCTARISDSLLAFVPTQPAERVLGQEPMHLGEVDVVALALVPLVRSEEHTSELQSLTNLVCRLLLEKQN